MDKKDVLKVRLDLEKGAYIVSRGDDEEPIIKSIVGSNPDYKVYDKKTAQTRRKEIEAELLGLREAPTKLLAQVDPILYDALEEFDKKYGTNYRIEYFKATTMQIGTTVAEKKSDYIERIKATRGKQLEDAGISIEYDLSLKGKGISLGNRIQAFKFALAQRNNSGIKINYNGRNELLDGSYSSELSGAEIFEESPKSVVNPTEIVKGKIQEIQQGLQGVLQTQLSRITSLKSKLQKSQSEVPEQPVVPDPSVQAQQPVTPAPSVQIQQPVVPAPSVQTQQPVVPDPSVQAQQPVTPDPKTQAQQPVVPDPKAQAQQPVVPDPKTQVQQPVASNSKKTTKKKRIKKVKTPEGKTKFGRSKKIQADKTKAREASKLKNSYKSKIEAKEEARRLAGIRKAEAERQKREADAKAAEKAKKAQVSLDPGKVVVPDPIQNPAIEPQDQDTQTPKTSVIRFGGEAKEGTIARFTRKLKNIEDSIRNKKYIPYIKEHKRRIAGIAAAALLVAGGIGAVIYNSNNNPNIDNTTPTSTETVVKAPKGELSEIEKDIISGVEQGITSGIKDNVTPSSPANDVIENNGNITVQTPSQDNSQTNKGEEPETSTEKDSRVEYLSSIKVGATMHIESGKYFETPEGTGNYGYFENHQDGFNKLTIIGVATNEGYFAIKDDSVNLYELKQKYPEAKFSFHFVNVKENGTELTLGWLTENSREHEIEHNVIVLDDEGR